MARVATGAPESANTLPRGIYSPEFIYGIVDGLSERFDAGGTLIKVTDPYHVDLTGPNLAKLHPLGGTLVKTLNSWGTERIGDQIVLPSVDFKANPTINYFVLNPAYGLKDNLAVGFGIPFIHFKNQMEIISTGTSNVESLRAYVKGINPEIDAGLTEVARLSQNLPTTVQQILSAKGYKPVGLTEFSTVGDMQIYARYKYLDNDLFRFAVRPYVLLPTGRGDDPDDLGDFAIGGLTGVGTFLTQEFKLSPIFRTSLILQYQAHIPDRVDRRIPASAEDPLPGLDRKENVARQAGNLFDATLAGRFRLSRTVELGSFYDFTTKDPDWFSGNRGYDYGLLSRDSGFQTHRLGAFVELSTTELYFEKRMPVPLILGYTFTSVVSAVNSPNQSTHVLNMRMFF